VICVTLRSKTGFSDHFADGLMRKYGGWVKVSGGGEWIPIEAAILLISWVFARHASSEPSLSYGFAGGGLGCASQTMLVFCPNISDRFWRNHTNVKRMDTSIHEITW